MYKLDVPAGWVYRPTPYMRRSLTEAQLAQIAGYDREPQYNLTLVMAKAEARATPAPQKERARQAAEIKPLRTRASWVTA